MWSNAARAWTATPVRRPRPGAPAASGPRPHPRVEDQPAVEPFSQVPSHRGNRGVVHGQPTAARLPRGPRTKSRTRPQLQSQALAGLGRCLRLETVQGVREALAVLAGRDERAAPHRRDARTTSRPSGRAGPRPGAQCRPDACRRLVQSEVTEPAQDVAVPPTDLARRRQPERSVATSTVAATARPATGHGRRRPRSTVQSSGSPSPSPAPRASSPDRTAAPRRAPARRRRGPRPAERLAAVVPGRDRDVPRRPVRRSCGSRHGFVRSRPTAAQRALPGREHAGRRWDGIVAAPGEPALRPFPVQHLPGPVHDGLRPWPPAGDRPPGGAQPCRPPRHQVGRGGRPGRRRWPSGRPRRGRRYGRRASPHRARPDRATRSPGRGLRPPERRKQPRTPSTPSPSRSPPANAADPAGDRNPGQPTISVWRAAGPRSASARSAPRRRSSASPQPGNCAARWATTCPSLPADRCRPSRGSPRPASVRSRRRRRPPPPAAGRARAAGLPPPPRAPRRPPTAWGPSVIATSW